MISEISTPSMYLSLLPVRVELERVLIVPQFTKVEEPQSKIWNVRVLTDIEIKDREWSYPWYGTSSKIKSYKGLSPRGEDEVRKRCYRIWGIRMEENLILPPPQIHIFPRPGIVLKLRVDRPLSF
jgi:hypothetical protein